MFSFKRVGLLGFCFLFSFHAFAELNESSGPVSFADQREHQCVGLIGSLSPTISDSDSRQLAEISDHLIVRKNPGLVTSEHIRYLLDLFYQESTDRHAFLEYVQFLGIGRRLWGMDDRGEFKTLLDKHSGLLEENIGSNKNPKAGSFLKKPRSPLLMIIAGYLALTFGVSKMNEEGVHFNEEILPMLYTGYLSDQLTNQRVFFARQDDLENELEKMWNSQSISFPENIFIKSSSFDETTEGQEFVADLYSSNSYSNARQTATYGFRGRYGQFEEAGFETIEISMYQNYKNQGKKLFVEIGSIDGRLKKIYYYTPENGLRELLYTDYKDY